MDGVFITGTDTSVGKTVVCAGLLKLLHGSREVCYWKPVQTGSVLGDDTAEVRSLTELDKSFLEPTYRFPDPVSPHFAARKWGKTIELEPMVKTFQQAKQQGRFVIAEGAGGVLVPFNEETLQIHFIQRLGLPVILVGEDRVGGINHALLSLNACREAGVQVLGVILTRARGTLGNAESISHFGKVDILAQLDPSEDVRTLVARVSSDSKLRSLFGVPTLPL